MEKASIYPPFDEDYNDIEFVKPFNAEKDPVTDEWDPGVL